MKKSIVCFIEIFFLPTLKKWLTKFPICYLHLRIIHFGCTIIAKEGRWWPKCATFSPNGAVSCPEVFISTEHGAQTACELFFPPENAPDEQWKFVTLARSESIYCRARKSNVRAKTTERKVRRSFTLLFSSGEGIKRSAIGNFVAPFNATLGMLLNLSTTPVSHSLPIYAEIVNFLRAVEKELSDFLEFLTIQSLQSCFLPFPFFLSLTRCFYVKQLVGDFRCSAKS